MGEHYTMTEPQIAAFLSESDTETLFYFAEIGNSDSELFLHVYTRNERNAKRALEDLRQAIDTVLADWNKNLKPPAGASKGSADYSHAGIRWPLSIIRTAAH
jgi:hypothetical protein